MNKEIELINLSNPKNIAELLKEPAVKMAEVITGVLISNKDDWKLSAGKLVQAALKSTLFQQLGREIKDYQEKGRIAEDYLVDPKNLESLHDILNFIDETPPDGNRFDAMKRLFLKSTETNISTSDQVLTHHFMKICRQLESGHLLVLKSAYDISNRRVSPKASPDPNNIDLHTHHRANWLAIIANQIGHGLSSLVEIYENKLIELKLITSITMPDQSGIGKTDHFRLTDVGYKFCEFLYKNE